MVTKTVIAHMEDSGFGTEGVHLFHEFMPEDTERGVLVLQPAAGAPINQHIPGYFRSGFQVIVRDKSFHKGDDIIKQVVTLLEKSANIESKGWRLRTARATHLPIHYRISDGKLFEHSVNFDATFEAL